ncbi:ARPP-1 family domain-containing protein [Bacteroidota bacterium]
MRTAKRFAGLLLVIMILLTVFLSSIRISDRNEGVSGSDQESKALKAYTIENSVKYKNIEIFMVSGITQTDKYKYVTLQHALEEGLLLVYETSQVNELKITNNSDDAVYIIAGDIVKGGKQDRTFANDMILPPKIKDVPIESFCVESGRWQQRGVEEDAYFSASYEILPSADLKIATKHRKNQNEVWDKVAEQQGKLKDNISYMMDEEVEVVDKDSPSSLQLTLENKELNKIRDDYQKPFQSLLSEFNNSMGYAYAINGELKGIEIFNNKQLFIDLWEKLLKAMIVEAISELDTNTLNDINKRDIFEFASRCEKGMKESDSINSRTKIDKYENKENILFVTFDLEIENWVHKSYLKIDTNKFSGKGSGGVQENIQQRIIDVEYDHQLQPLQE